MHESTQLLIILDQTGNAESLAKENASDFIIQLFSIIMWYQAESLQGTDGT